MTVNVNIYVQPHDEIAHQTHNGVHWIRIGEALVFAFPVELKRIRAAINDRLEAITPAAHGRDAA